MTGLPSGLLLITDRKQARHPLKDVCAAALDAGFAAIMLREKDLEANELLDTARPLHELCLSCGAHFLINERLDVALAFPGTGAHLGCRGIPVPDARRLLDDRVLGYSAHEIAEAAGALAQGADYVTLSPIFPSQSKPGLEPRGISFLTQGTAELGRDRVVALGGMNAETLGQVRTGGAHGAAVMGEMMRAEDPAKTARELMAAWDAGG